MGLLLLMGDSGFRGALDTLGSGLESAWSVGRRLRTGYTGAIIRVRRSSDNAESDFSGSGANGAVSASAVAAFCGAGNGFLTTIYDQSGNGRNLVQATTTIQPLVVSSGTANTENGYLAAAFNGSTSSRRLAVAASTAIYKFLHDGTSATVYFVKRVTDDALQKIVLTNYNSSLGGTGYRIFYNGTERLAAEVENAGTNAVTVSFLGSAAFNVETVFTDPDNATAANRILGWRDASALSGANAETASPSSSNAEGDLTLGTSTVGGIEFNGNICELAIWSQDLAASRATWETNAKAFWGTP